MTRRVRGLEQGLGTQLLRRKGRGVMLTEAGRNCISVAERMVAELAALQIAAGGATAIAGPLRIGMSEIIALTWIDRLLGRIAQAFPRLVPELHIDLTMALLRKLATREIDLALLPGPVPLRDAVTVPLGRCTLRWMASPHLVPAGTTVTPGSLAALPILAMAPESDIYGVMQTWFRRAGATPGQLTHCNSFNVLVSLVRKRLGVSLMPEELLGRFISAGKLAVLAEHPRMPPATYAAAYLPRDDLSVLPEIAGFAREEAASPNAWRDANALE